MPIDNSLGAEYTVSGRKRFTAPCTIYLEKLPFEMFFCVKKGNITVTAGEESIAASENEVIPVVADIFCRIDFENDTEITYVGTDFRIFSSLRVLSLFDIPSVFTGEPGVKISHLCDNIIKTVDEGMFTNFKLENSVSMCVALYSLEKAVLDESVPKQSGEETVTKFEKLAPVFYHIRNERTGLIMRKDLSELVGISEDSFYRIFKSAVGCAPKDFIISEKLSTTRINLIKTDDTVGKISEDIGYSGQFYYSSLFKKKYGVCPTEYRRKTAWLNEQ